MAQLLEAVMDRGRALAESKEFSRYFKDKSTGLPTLDEKKAAVTAYLMGVEKEFIEGLSEDTRVASIGSFEKYVFPIIRAVFPNLVATELVSVQPMQSPTSLVFYMDFRAGSKKGSVNLGDSLISSRTGQADSTDYSGENINAESVGTGGSNVLVFAGVNLSYFPVRPYSVVITVSQTDSTNGSRKFTDNGNGVLVGSGLTGTNTIDYSTGAMTLTFATHGPDTGIPIEVSYNYASEGSLQVPQVDVSITSVPVVAKPRKLRARWSVEAANQMRAVHGSDTDTEVTTAIAEELRFDIDREIINDLLNVAASPDNASHDYSFYMIPPSSVSFFEHKMTIIDVFIRHSNAIFKATRRAQGNWIVIGLSVANIVESLPTFQPTAVTGSGVVYMGDLNGRWRIYKDPFMDDDTFLMGHRGDSMMQTGYIYAPWIPLYTTPTITLDDFTTRKGLMTQYGKKIVNGLFYTKGLIVHSQL